MDALKQIADSLIGWAIFGVAILVLVLTFRFYFDRIEPWRKRTGFLVQYFGGREPADGISVSYFEADKELHFFSDRDEMTFQVPDEDLWDRTMPDFFRGKQSLVLARLQHSVPKQTSIRLINEYAGDRSILYVDTSKAHGERTVSIGQKAESDGESQCIETS